MKVFDSKLASQITNIKRRTVQYWIALGIVQPDIEAFPGAEGRGKKWLFSPSNIIELLFVKKLGKLGCSLQLITSIMNRIRLDRKYKDYFNPELLSTGTYVIYFGEERKNAKKDKKGYPPELVRTPIVVNIDKSNTFSLPTETINQSEYIMIVSLNDLYNQVKRHFR